MAKCPKCGKKHNKSHYLSGTTSYKCSKGHEWTDGLRLMSFGELNKLENNKIDYGQWLSNNRPY